MAEEAYKCKSCEDTGYHWADTEYPCPYCDEGRAVQHRHDIQRLQSITETAKVLRKRIAEYEAEHPNG